MLIADVNPKDLEGVEPLEFGGPIVGTTERFSLKALINVPQATVGIEDFLPGTTVHWAHFHDEVQYILQGEVEATYTLVPDHSKVNTVRIKAGQSVLILNGTRATYKVLSKEPYSHLFVIMPRYHFDKWLLKQEYDGIPLSEYRQRMA